MCGEMLPAELAALYTWVYEAAPLIALEVGTSSGCGSTFYISKAIEDNGLGGTLHTCDIKAGCQDYQNVMFQQMKSTDMINWMIQEGLIPDFIFFDGPEEASIALNDIRLLEPHLKIDTMFAMHDWYIGKRCFDGLSSVKAKQIRPYMEASDNWELVYHLQGDVPTDNSVGLVLYKKIGDSIS